MPHYIIRDAWTGYLWGDTRDIEGRPLNGAGLTPVDACRALDESLGTLGREYQEVARLSGETGYLVYSADTDPPGSDAVPLIHDGQAREAIEMVERDCTLVCCVEWTSPAE